MPFAVGDQVRSTVDSARVGVITRLGPLHGGIQYYEVFWGGPAGTQMVPETDLQAHQTVGRPTEALANGIVVGYAEFQRLITFHRISRERPLRNNIYAFNASRTQFHPFQFKPLIKLLDSATGRLLVCDEVGLGKTIEAGLILLEEQARRDLRTILVICPSGLRAKWQLELRSRFDEQFSILDAKAFREFLDDYERAPDRAQLAGIISLETVRGRDILARIEDVSPVFDMVIVDEAHHMRNFGTLSRRVGVTVGSDAGSLLLLTATPVHLGTENLYSLLTILDERDFPDLATADERFRQNEPVVAAQRLVGGGAATAVQAMQLFERAATSPWLREHPLVPRVRSNLSALAKSGDTAAARRLVVQVQRDLTELNLLGHIFTRTRKRDVKIKVPVREAYAWTVELTPLERQFYEAVSALVYEERRRRTDSPIVLRWALNTLQRRMASSIHATVEHYHRNPSFDSADWGDDDERPEVAPEGQSPDLEALRRSVSELLGRWPPDTRDSKYERLAVLVREQQAARSGVKLLVFAFFKETLRYLSRRLGRDGIDHVLIDGDVPPDERERLIARFREDPNCQLMLSSRVGSEGLDFQFSDTLVNYDLPWNPMEVEQRIGRLDRIGQHAEKILIFNLWTADTIEERILGRLYERIGIFERSIGALDAVIGALLEDLEAVLMDPGLRPEQQAREMERIARVVETERQNLDQLEEQAAAFVGVDAFFDEEIEGIRRARRYVTGEQLLRFLEDYLRHKAPGTRLRYDRQARCGVLVPDAGLRRLVQQHHRAGELLRLMGAGPEGLAFTVDAEVAFENPRLEFINVLYPLIEIIRADYDEDLRERVSAQHVALRTKRLTQGEYLFVVYRLRVDGARTLNFLEAVILDDGLKEACDRETAEAVIGEMVELGGERPGGAMSVESQFAAQAVRRAEAAFLERLQMLRMHFEQDNAALVDRRTASLRFHMERKVERRREVLSRQMREGKPERILQMTRGLITKLEGELERHLRELEVHRHVQVGYDEVAAGILEVVA